VIALLATEVLVIVGALVGMFWLKRAADRAWARHQQMRQIREAYERLARAIGDQLLPAVRQMADPMSAMVPKMQALCEAIKKARP